MTSNQTKALVREAQPDEAQKLTELAHLAKAHWGYSPEFMAAFDAELTFSTDDLNSARHIFRVSSVNNNINGFYALDLKSEGEGKVEMSALFVAPTDLGKGFGKHLFEHAAEKARQSGARTMLIHSDPYAAGFYRKLGAINLGNVASRSIEGREIPLLEYAL